jgi:hypothetical protein
MTTSGFARGPENIRAVVQALRDQGTPVTGPYQTPKGALVYILADFVVTDRELVELASAGKVSPAAVSEFIAKIRKKGA